MTGLASRSLIVPDRRIEAYQKEMLPGEALHPSSDFFKSYTGYTEQVVTGTATWGLTRMGLGVKFSGQSGNDISCALKAIPSGPPLTIETCWLALVQNTTNPMVGLVLTDGTATTSNGFGIGDFSAFGTASISGTLTNMNTTLLGNAIERARIQQGLILVRLIWKSSNTFSWNVSVDGINWVDFGITDPTPTLTPTHMGFCVSAWSGIQAYTASFPYLRVYEADLSV